MAIVRWFDIGDLPQRAGRGADGRILRPWLVVSFGRRGSDARRHALHEHEHGERRRRGAGGVVDAGVGRHAKDCPRRCGIAVPTARATRVYRACPSRSSRLCGDGWIAIGEAAIALDPLAGQGVALAFETAFRAFEAAGVDPSWRLLGTDYRDALLSRFHAHLDGRARVYEEAGAVLPRSFFRSAVMTRA